MNTISAIIIEDELPAAELLFSYLQKYPEINVIERCKDGFTGLKGIQEHKPDLVFLDIQMPKLTGFELLELLDEKPFVIFTTAYDEFAIKAFEMNAVDYLLKPFSQERFDKAIQKAKELIETKSPIISASLNELSKTVANEQSVLERIVVKNNSNISVIPTHKISHIEAYDDYVIIHSEGKKHLKNKSMQFYEQHLNQRMFVRIHRKYIVNVDYIQKIMLWEKETYMVKLTTEDELRASRAGYKRLKELF
jgi:two-component system LytT family response regulator